RRARDADRLHRAPRALPGQAQQSVVGPDEDATVPATHGNGPPLGAHLWIDDRHVHPDREVTQGVAQDDRALTDVVARYSVRDVDNRDPWPDRPDHRVAYTHELVV